MAGAIETLLFMWLLSFISIQHVSLPTFPGIPFFLLYTGIAIGFIAVHMMLYALLAVLWTLVFRPVGRENQLAIVQGKLKANAPARRIGELAVQFVYDRA